MDLITPQHDRFYSLEEFKKKSEDKRVIVIKAFLTDLVRKRLVNL
ncbi:MAG: hypothetical protein ACKO7Y_06450 [Candidatus Nitrosotenuis sp.]